LLLMVSVVFAIWPFPSRLNVFRQGIPYASGHFHSKPRASLEGRSPLLGFDIAWPHGKGRM